MRGRFNTKFDALYRTVDDRLRRYDSTDACGAWNATLIEDFRCDTDLITNAHELFSQIVAQHTQGKCVASDGLDLETAMIDLGKSIVICFRLHFLDAPNGYGIAPAKFSVIADITGNNCKTAILCCGLREPDGDFWYPSTRRIPNVVLPNDYVWAYFQSREYGPPTIASWIDRRSRKGGEPSDAPESPNRAF